MHIDTQSGLPISIANMLRVNFVPRRRSPHALFHPSTSTGVGGGGWVGGGGCKAFGVNQGFLLYKRSRN